MRDEIKFGRYGDTYRVQAGAPVPTADRREDSGFLRRSLFSTPNGSVDNPCDLL